MLRKGTRECDPFKRGQLYSNRMRAFASSHFFRAIFTYLGYDNRDYIHAEEEMRYILQEGTLMLTSPWIRRGSSKKKYLKIESTKIESTKIKSTKIKKQK